MVSIEINGKEIRVPDGVSVAAAVFLAGESGFRTSVTGEPRAPICGMGICFECRLTIDDIAHRRSCQVKVQNGMKIRTRS